MPAEKLSITVTPELAAALRALAERRGEDLSRTIEILLRENRLVAEEVEAGRRRDALPRTKKGRDVDELRVLARLGRAQWERAVAEGRVRPVGEQ